MKTINEYIEQAYIDEINIIEEDIPYVSTHKQEIVDRYTEIFTDLMSR